MGNVLTTFLSIIIPFLVPYILRVFTKSLHSDTNINQKVSSAMSKKHKQQKEDEEHEPLSSKISRKLSSSSSIKSTESITNQKDSSTMPKKNKRQAKDEEHESLPKSSNKHSSTQSSSSSSKGGKEGEVVPKLKRKRADTKEEHGALPKVARTKSPIHNQQTAGSDAISPKTMALEMAIEEPTRSNSAQKLKKRKRTEDDEKHGSLSKMARQNPPVRSSDNVGSNPLSPVTPAQKSKRRRSLEDGEISEAAEEHYSPAHASAVEESIEKGASPSSPKLKRKRFLGDNEHGALSKAARTYSPIQSPDVDILFENESSPSPSTNKRKRSPNDDNEHGALPKAARTYSPVQSSDVEQLFEGESSPLSPTLKRKRSLNDDEHGALSKAARTYSPVGSSVSGRSHVNKSPKTLKHKLSEDSDDQDISASPSKKPRYSSTRPASAVRKRKHCTVIDLDSDSEAEEEVNRPPKYPRHTKQANQDTDNTIPYTPKRKRTTLPWHNPDYPYNTKRPRTQLSTDTNSQKEPTSPYEPLRYHTTDKTSRLKWTRFGILLGELTHLTAPPPPAPLLPPKPPAPGPIHHLKKREQRRKEKAKAKKQAQKPHIQPPKVEYKKEIKEKYFVYAKFNHNMRFALSVVPEQTIRTTEYRRTNAVKGKENRTKGTVPTVMVGTSTKVSYRKQRKVELVQFDLLLVCGRMVWEGEWNEVFERGVRNRENGMMMEGEVIDSINNTDLAGNDKENVGERVKEDMPGMIAIMRKVMACPPPNERIAKRIRSFEVSGRFDGRFV